MNRANGPMLAEASHRLAEAVARAARTVGPPTPLVPLERALRRGDRGRQAQAERRLQAELDPIDSAW